MNPPRCLLAFVPRASKSVVCCGFNLENCRTEESVWAGGVMLCSIIVMQQTEVVKKCDVLPPPGTPFTVTHHHWETSAAKSWRLAFVSAVSPFQNSCKGKSASTWSFLTSRHVLMSLLTIPSDWIKFHVLLCFSCDLRAWFILLHSCGLILSFYPSSKHLSTPVERPIMTDWQQDISVNDWTCLCDSRSNVFAIILG